MSWPVIKEAALNVWDRLFPLALVALALYWLLREWLSVRLKASVEHEYDKRLESHKSQLQTEHEVAIERLRADAANLRAMQDVARSSLLAVHTFSQERRLKAIEVVWDATRKLCSDAVSALTILDCLKREEFSTAMNNPKIRPVLAACRTLVARLFCDDDGLHLKSERAQAYREHACTICQR